MPLLGILLSSTIAAPAAKAQGVLWGGFLGAYTEGTGGGGAFQRRDARIDFNWQGQGPGGSVSPAFKTAGWSGFSGVWTGTVIPSVSETYTFTLASTDSAALYIRKPGTTGWTELINDPSQASKTDRKAMALEAGQSYDLSIHYTQHSKSGALQLGWSSPTVPQQVIDAATPLGINGSTPVINDQATMFADAAKEARHFGGYSDVGVSVALDADGWPRTDATLPLWSNGLEMHGTYEVSFNGEAKLTDWNKLGSFVVGGKSYGTVLPAGVGYDAATNLTRAKWVVSATGTTAANIGFATTRRTAGSAVGSGVTGLKIMRPVAPGSTTSYADGELFNAHYKALLSYFTGIRFMDYLAMTGNKLSTWSERSLPSDATQDQLVSGWGWQGKGGALEYLVALANETGKDAWINVPLYADDDYVIRLAQLLAYGSDGKNPYTSRQANPTYPPLNANLKIYVEYSNELWNAHYPQQAGNEALAVSAVAAGGSPLNYDGATSPTIWAQRRVVDRTRRISDLFRAVWSDSGMMSRVRPVFEWQYANSNNTAAVGLTFLENYYGNADGGQHVSIARPANYYLWGGGAGWYVTSKSPAAASVEAILGAGQTNPSTEGDTIWAEAFGLHEMGYEGGFEVGGDSPSAVQLLANRSAAAEGEEIGAIDRFFQLGGGYPFVFNAAGNNAYGIASPTTNELSTPKMAAIIKAITAPRPTQTFAFPIPGRVPLAFDMGVSPSGKTTDKLSHIGDYLAWTVSVAKPGTFTVTTNAATPSNLTIIVDGKPVGRGTWTGALTTGLHGIRVRNLSAAGTTLSQLVVTQ
ncbi:MAG: Fibronectin type domain protein [Rhodospirillales bacterium]|nr:Fibronectin type domain protein [Rhodospirillales bacterium]